MVVTHTKSPFPPAFHRLLCFVVFLGAVIFYVHIIAHVVVVFTVNLSFYPTSAHPVPVLILHPRTIPGTKYVVADCETEETKISAH